MSERFWLREQLDALPMHAVVYDQNNQVFQHLPSKLSLSGKMWFQPGSISPFSTSDIALPARLLDDGL